jgi:hypothetical protein
MHTSTGTCVYWTMLRVPSNIVKTNVSCGGWKWTDSRHSCFQMTFHFVFFTQSVKLLELKQVQLISLWKPKNNKHDTCNNTFNFPSTTTGSYYTYTYFRIQSISSDHKTHPNKHSRIMILHQSSQWYCCSSIGLLLYKQKREIGIPSIQHPQMLLRNKTSICTTTQTTIVAIYCKVVYGKGHIHEYGNGKLRAQLWNNLLHKPMDTWNLFIPNKITVNAYVVGHLILKITYLLPSATSTWDGKYPSVTTVTNSLRSVVYNKIALFFPSLSALCLAVTRRPTIYL